MADASDKNGKEDGNDINQAKTKKRPKARQEAASHDLLLCFVLVGVRGFEPPTTSTPLKCATGLRYTPSGDFDRW